MAKRARPEGSAPADAGSVDDVLALVREHGGRVTSSRRLLLSVLFGANGHRTAEELASEVQERSPDVHLSTIYRNLEELERLGVIVHTHVGHGPVTYHLAPATHGHFVCEECGRMIEVPGALFEDLSRAAASGYGFTVDPHHFAVLGRCRRCGSRPDR